MYHNNLKLNALHLFNRNNNNNNNNSNNNNNEVNNKNKKFTLHCYYLTFGQIVEEAFIVIL